MKKNILCIALVLTVILSIFPVAVFAENEKLDINTASINIYINQSYQLTVTGTSENIMFYSDEPSIAEVSGDGNITAKSLGTTKINVETASGLSAQCVVNVLNGVSPKDIVISSQEITLKVGESSTIKATVKPEEADGTLTFTTSDSSIVRVDSNGYIKALKTGVAVVTVTSKSDAVFKKCIVKVNANTEPSGANITVKGSVFTITGDKKANVFMELRNSNGFKRVKTDENGTFTIHDVRQGEYALLAYRAEKDTTPYAKTQLTAGNYNLNITCIINGNEIMVLYQNNADVESDIKELMLMSEEVTLKSGETYDMKFYARPSKAVLPAVMGETDDEEIATVDADGRITAVSEGTAVITFSTVDGRLSKSCKVIVSDSKGNKYSWLIITVETSLALICLVAFAIRYRRFVKNKEKEEFGFDGEDEL